MSGSNFNITSNLPSNESDLSSIGEKILQANYTAPGDTSFHLVDNGSGDVLKVDITTTQSNQKVLVTGAFAVRRSPTTANGIVLCRITDDASNVVWFGSGAPAQNDDVEHVAFVFTYNFASAGAHYLQCEIATGNGTQPAVAYSNANTRGRSFIQVTKLG